MSLAGSDSSIDGLSAAARESRPPRPPAQQPAAPSEPAAIRHSRGTHVSQIWLDGDVLACACPECNAPMTIRLWLALAECRMCGTQVELTEEQEREAQRLLDSRAVPRDEIAPSAETTIVAPPPTSWTQTPARRKPLPPIAPPSTPPVVKAPIKPPPPKPPAAKAPPPLIAILVIEPPPLLALMARSVGVDAPPVVAEPRPPKLLSRTLLEAIISCLVSLLAHLALVILLGLWFYPKLSGRSIVLQAEFRAGGGQREQVEAVVQTKPKEPPPQDPPAAPVVEVQPPVEPEPPSKPQPELKPDVAALVVAPQAPEVNYFAAGVVKPGTMFAGRDPRHRAEIVQREGGTDATEQAVARGLRWLAGHQAADGSWSLDGFASCGDCNGRCDQPGMSSDTAATALGLLPFLGAGHTTGAGEYRETVRRGLDALIAQQRPDGSFDRIGGGRMYAHGLAAIALCEAYALTKDRNLQQPAQRAVDYITAAQHAAGGWRYTPRSPGDLSVVGWQLMALRSAQTSYLSVPEATLVRAAKFLDTVQTSKTEATFCYMQGSGVSPAMTAEGLLSRLYGGVPAANPALLAGADYLLLEHPPTRDDVDLYYWYYGTQAMHHLGGARWTKWNERMRELLVDLQVREGHAAGSWNPGRHHDPAGGRLYATALAVCTLEVYYRHLPLYRTAPPAATQPKATTPRPPTPAAPTPTKQAQLR